MRRVKIVCTLGPASSSEEMLERLVQAGMDVARLNCSHGTTEERLAVIRRLRAVAERHRRPIGILLDLRGPRLRLGALPPGGVELTPGQELPLVTEGTEAAAAHPEALPVQSPYLATGVRPGQPIFINDGLTELVVLGTDGVTLRTRVVRGGRLTSHKGINAPGAALAVPILEAEDLEDLRRTLQEGIDAVAVSFVRTAEDLRQVQSAVHAFRPGLPLMAKLETAQALQNLDRLLDASEMIMIARGDLGVELPPEEVPVLQKRLVAAARARGRPVITATQMLESMVEHERPTRAEASDVANAVFDGTDGVMLSAETTIGRHPATVVEMMDRIVTAAEREWLSPAGAGAATPHQAVAPTEAVAEAACHAADQLQARALVAFTQSGSTARLLSRYRPQTPLVAFTPDPAIARQLNFCWGVQPRVLPRAAHTDALIREMEVQLLESGLVSVGETVVLVAGIPLSERPPANFFKVHRVAGAR